ncbi:DNA primase [Candidatus Kaiserbacteria bacterium RIFCSPLOWO2_01_FULL_53_17]|uniref:DNA primase n=1 Tax=Candidatus Kaiserbacteria bacterium RIFCSPLOWO2_01_FULL_53_17 TaxID=1798511 RepID=A0A1F6EI55_9BACT|nr:MAG: DNA primase [Candidatus Kaiserbacteria bacterium RIFCSPLOWO2_01_FULL_53_17]
MSDTVQQVKDRLSIVDVVSGYVKLDRAGQNMRARCPFHAERTPSFIVSPDRGTYHCFGCSVGGDIFSFVEAIEGVDFKGALKILAERAGVPLVYSKGGSPAGEKDDTDRLFEAIETATIFYQSQLNNEAEEYLKKRGLEKKTITAFRIGYAGDEWSELSDHLKQKKFTDKEILDAGLAKKGDKGLTDKFRNRIMFPIADNAGRVVAFSGRVFGEKAHPDAPKYLNSPETPLYHKSRILYGFDRAKQTIRKHNFAILVEGQMDLILSHQAGWANTVAVSGTAFTVEHAALLKRMSENLVIALDADEAGFKAAARAARAALQQGLNVKVAQLPKELDPADFILTEGPEAWRARIREAKDIITFLLDVLEERSKSKDNFRRAVETAVLPFLADVQSPIAREQYEREIAGRLGVSESAVAQARSRLKVAPEPFQPHALQPAPAQNLGRAQQAYGLLLWQESMRNTSFDVQAFRHSLTEAIGKAALQKLEEMSEDEKERLRFRAEALYGKNGRLQHDADMILAILTRERLQRELRETTDSLKAAEKEGKKAEIEKLLKRSQQLTTAIAKNSKEE